MQDSKYRLDNLYRRLDSVQGSLTRHLDHAESMTPGGRQLLSRTQRLLDDARSALSFRWDRTGRLNPTVRERVRLNLCDDFTAVVRELAMSLLPALDGAVSHRVPAELEPALQRMASAAASPLVPQVLLYASDRLNYSIERHNDPLGALGKILSPEGPPEASPLGPFLFLRVPEVERDTAILHGIILGHELGHLRDWANDISAQLVTGIPAPWLEPGGALMKDHVQDFVRYAGLVDRWANEIVADVFAVELLGPASLLAFGELIGGLGGWTKDSPTHPAPDRRASIIVDLLIDRGFSEIHSLEWPLRHYMDVSSSSALRPVVFGEGVPNDPGDFAWKRVKEGLPHLIGLCRDSVPDDERFAATEWEQVEEARQLLASGRTCGESQGQGVPTPVRDAVIMNAAWMVRLYDLPALGDCLGVQVDSPEATSLVSSILDGLVLKSFDIANHRRMNPWS